LEACSFFSPKLTVRDCRIGRGIFAVQPVAKGERLLDFSTGPGKYLNTREAYLHEKAGNHYIIQVEDELYLVAVDGPEPNDFINHSCDPTCGVKGRVVFVAMRDIAPGEEITFDYCMTEAFPWYKLNCRCGTSLCRGLVTGEDWKKLELQARYSGYFSDYIQKKIDQPVFIRKAVSGSKRIVRGFRKLFGAQPRR
jgi:uncharacterized protein